MRLTLYQGAVIGATAPENLPPGGNATLQIDGVVSFKQEHTTYVTFVSETAMKNAFWKTDWAPFAADKLILEASTAMGIGRMVILAKGIAYQSHSLEA